ncbi:hypothetical protein [Rossellomorea marisflavi]|uniref:hypothetical protein n=1 Tax=Rossellomorea marisflavi TaxID=189381 RepID=UPI00064E66A1|nr:hypothetical protein [Rossellomorea marisflavi]KML00566.1 hypothetical protein VL06_20820 [Rossellomorea marisflavi]
MRKIDKFGFKLDDMEATPYFEVTSNYRIRFLMDTFENNINLLKNVLTDTLKNGQTIDTTFISGYIRNKKRYREYIGIGEFIKITNWRETIVKEEEHDVIYSTITDVNISDVNKYCQKVANGYREAFIMFYNDDFLIYVSSDVLDIISYESGLISNLKQKYSSEYNTFYEHEVY